MLSTVPDEPVMLNSTLSALSPPVRKIFAPLLKTAEPESLMTSTSLAFPEIVRMWLMLIEVTSNTVRPLPSVSV